MSLSTREIIELKQVFMIRRRRLVNPMRIDYANGAFYRGETNAAGLPHGWGETLYKNNTVIAGKWIDGVMSGKGVYMSTEMTYKGDWKNNAFDGKGKLIYHDEHYEGEFANNERSGHGKLSWSSGSSYIGDWKNDVPHGVGSMNTHNTYYIGHWIDGQQREDGLVIRAK